MNWGTQMGNEGRGSGRQMGAQLTQSTDRTLETAVSLLLVDDDEQWARATARLLEAAETEFDVAVAHSLAEGRDRFRADDYECVVCDYQLGDGTGLALLETVRELDPDCPFVLITGRGDEAVASEAIGNGVTDYIPKNQDDNEATVLTNRVTNAVTSARTRRQLDRERRGKAATLDVLTSTTNVAELSAQFCRILVEEQGYAAAWIGSIDDDADHTVVPRAVEGCKAYLDAVLLTESTETAPIDPAVEAIRTDEPVVVSPDSREETALAADSDTSASWREFAEEYGFDSAAGVPITHDGVRVGVLGVYGSANGQPIDGPQWDRLAEYAEIIGHAYRTAEWKRSLLSEQSIRVDVEIGDSTAPLVELSSHLGTATTIEVPSTIDRPDDTTHYLACVSPGSPDQLSGAAEACASIECRDITVTEDGLRCDLYSSVETPERLVAAHGVQLHRTVVADGVATLSVSVPDHDTVSSLVETLETEYDAVTMSTLWNGDSDRSTGQDSDPMDSLTDRQREVLRYAYFDGYFDQPRGVSATDLAEKFDLARATLTQHLRAGQRKVFSELLDE